MESVNEGQHIQDNFPDLVESTMCTPLFLSGLLARKILSRCEMETIGAKETPSAKSFELYRILLTRTDKYIPFIETLMTENQSVAANILTEILPSPSQSQLQQLTTTTTTTTGAGVKRPSGDTTGSVHLKKSKSIESKTRLLFDVLAAVHLFTGRKDELQQLHKYTVGNDDDDDDESCSSEGITVISESEEITTVGGLGGIGKTELARQYLADYSHFFHYVIWVLAESLESTGESFGRLCADQLYIPTRNANGEQKAMQSLLEDVLQHVKGSNTLFVLDNAEQEVHVTKFIQAVQSHYKKENSRVHILITSRDTDWGTTQAINLHEMSLPDAIQFVKRGLAEFQTESNAGADDEVERLVITLQCFPLAIQQAISYILMEKKRKRRSYGISAYLADFETKDKVRQKLLSAPASRYKHLVGYTGTTYTTWEMTLDKIATFEEEGELALQILNVMAYLLPDNIPRSMFLPLSKDGDEELVASAVELLVRYSMIYGGEEDTQSNLRLHRLVQHVRRLKLGDCADKEMSVLKDAFEVVGGQIDDITTIGHCISVWNHAVKYPTLVSHHSEFPVKVVQCLNNNFRYADSHKFGLSADSALTPVLMDSQEEDELIHRLNCLTIDALHRSGEYLGATKLCDEKLPSRSKTLDILDLKFRKGHALVRMEGQESISLLQEAYEGRRNTLGPNHKSTKNALFIFAAARVNLGRVLDGPLINITDVTTALQDFVPSENEEWYDFFSAQICVGLLYLVGRRYAEAKVAWEKVYAYRLMENNKNNFGNHPQILNAGYNLAVVLNKLGDYDQAYKICKKVEEVRGSVLEKGHIDILLARQVIGVSLNGLGRMAEALQIQEGVYNLLRANDQYGEANVWTLFSKLNIGISWSLLGEHGKGLEAMKGAVKGMEDVFTGSHNEVFHAKFELAQAYGRDGQVADARKVFEAVREKILEIHGPTHELLTKIEICLEELIHQ